MRLSLKIKNIGEFSRVIKVMNKKSRDWKDEEYVRRPGMVDEETYRRNIQYQRDIDRMDEEHLAIAMREASRLNELLFKRYHQFKAEIAVVTEKIAKLPVDEKLELIQFYEINPLTSTGQFNTHCQKVSNEYQALLIKSEEKFKQICAPSVRYYQHVINELTPEINRISQLKGYYRQIYQEMCQELKHGPSEIREFLAQIDELKFPEIEIGPESEQSSQSSKGKGKSKSNGETNNSRAPEEDGNDRIHKGTGFTGVEIIQKYWECLKAIEDYQREVKEAQEYINESHLERLKIRVLLPFRLSGSPDSFPQINIFEKYARALLDRLKNRYIYLQSVNQLISSSIEVKSNLDLDTNTNTKLNTNTSPDQPRSSTIVDDYKDYQDKGNSNTDNGKLVEIEPNKVDKVDKVDKNTDKVDKNTHLSKAIRHQILQVREEARQQELATLEKYCEVKARWLKVEFETEFKLQSEYAAINAVPLNGILVKTKYLKGKKLMGERRELPATYGFQVWQPNRYQRGLRPSGLERSREKSIYETDEWRTILTDQLFILTRENELITEKEYQARLKKEREDISEEDKFIQRVRQNPRKSILSQLPDIKLSPNVREPIVRRTPSESLLSQLPDIRLSPNVREPTARRTAPESLLSQLPNSSVTREPTREST